MSDEALEAARDTTATQALERHSQISRQLASLFRERGELLSGISEAKVSAYDQALHEGANVTNARHASDVATVNFDRELHKVNGEISSLETEVHYIDQLMSYLRSQNARGT